MGSGLFGSFGNTHGSTSSPAEKSDIASNAKAAAEKFPIRESGYFGEQGKSHQVQIIRSDDPLASAKELFDILSKGGSKRKIDDNNPAKGIIATLDDGTNITYRPVSSSGPPAIDIHKPGSSSVKKQKIHFLDKE